MTDPPAASPLPAGLLRAVALALLLLLPAAAAQALSGAQKTATAKAVVAVQVHKDSETVARGSGFVIDASGHVLTSAAVLDAGDRVTVTAQGTQELAATVLLRDVESGLGLLRVDGLKPAALTAFTGPVAAQTLIHAVQRPPPPAAAVFVRGTVTTDKLETVGATSIRFVHHSALIAPHGYGGPAVDECGRVVGLNVPDPNASGFRTARHKLTPEGFVWALSVGEIASRLQRLGIALTATAEACTPAAAAPPPAGARPPSGDGAAQAREEADRARAEAAAAQERSLLIRRLAIWGGGAGIALLLAILLWWAVSARRRRRSMRAAQAEAAAADRRAALAQQRLDEIPEPAPFACILTGRGEDGTHYALKLQPDTLGNPAGIVVGRNPAGSAYVVADASVSREHVRFRVEEGALRVEDLESTNGTRLNGRRLKPGLVTRIEDGDELELGTVGFAVALES